MKDLSQTTKVTVEGHDTTKDNSSMLGLIFLTVSLMSKNVKVSTFFLFVILLVDDRNVENANVVGHVKVEAMFVTVVELYPPNRENIKAVA